MKFPLLRRSRHQAEVARLQERLAEAKCRIARVKKQIARAKASAQKHKGDLERLRAERNGELEWLHEVERICEIQAKQLECSPKVEGMGHAREKRPETPRSLGGVLAEEQIRGHRDLRPLFAMRLKGEGIEIGALHRPLPVPPDLIVRYVDLRSRVENIARYPEVPAQDIVETTYICDGQTLCAVPDESQDFVIANHMLEHCVNPLLAIRNFLRVLKQSGLMFISLPDKRFTFDYKRPATPWGHVLHDYEIVREIEDRIVYEEYRQCVDPNLDPDLAVATRHEIHHHAWTQSEILELFINCRRVLGWPLEVLYFAKQGCEVVLVIQKSDPPHEDHAKLHERITAGAGSGAATPP